MVRERLFEYNVIWIVKQNSNDILFIQNQLLHLKCFMRIILTVECNNICESKNQYIYYNFDLLGPNLKNNFEGKWH